MTKLIDQILEPFEPWESSGGHCSYPIGPQKTLAMIAEVRKRLEKILKSSGKHSLIWNEFQHASTSSPSWYWDVEVDAQFDGIAIRHGAEIAELEELADLWASDLFPASPARVHRFTCARALRAVIERMKGKTKEQK